MRGLSIRAPRTGFACLVTCGGCLVSSYACFQSIMAMVPLTASLTYLTADIRGTGGLIKERPEDFVVEEQPLYQPSGSGEHLYICVQKCELTTTDAVRRIARAFAVGKGDIGYAGMKDKHAITRQHFSVRLPDPSQDAAGLERLPYKNLTVLWAARHGNKLRRGHHAGNRFIIRVRKVDPAAVVRAKVILDRLAASGAPNFVGEQRFGYRQNNHLLGRLLLQRRFEELLDEMLGRPRDGEPAPTRIGREAYERRDYAAALEFWPRHLHYDRQALDQLRQGRSAERVVMGLDEAQRHFLISALQSAIFNMVLDQRLKHGSYDRLVEGDLAWKHDNGAVFTVDGPTAELENGPEGRVVKLGVSPSGPMWGRHMTRAGGQVDLWEQSAVEAHGISVTDFLNTELSGAEGVRRPLRVPLSDTSITAGVDEHGPYIHLEFVLPRGSFATVILREIIKPEQTGANIDTAEDEAG